VEADEMNVINMLKGPIIVGVATWITSMILSAQMAQWFGQLAIAATAATAVLLLDLAKIEY